MSFVRAIFVALITLSVAALPVASGMARAAMTLNASIAAPKTECCPHHQPCEKKTNDCGSMAGCALKVLQLFRHHGFGRGFQAQCGSCGQAGAAKLGAELQPDCATSTSS